MTVYTGFAPLVVDTGTDIGAVSDIVVEVMVVAEWDRVGVAHILSLAGNKVVLVEVVAGTGAAVGTVVGRNKVEVLVEVAGHLAWPLVFLAVFFPSPVVSLPFSSPFLFSSPLSGVPFQVAFSLSRPSVLERQWVVHKGFPYWSVDQDIEAEGFLHIILVGGRMRV
ncbi:MAG: hypothetical protein QXH13_03095 [Thermoplasmata archaeon]